MKIFFLLSCYFIIIDAYAPIAGYNCIHYLTAAALK